MGRKKLYIGVMCSYCGERPAKIKGLCLKCYKSMTYINKNYKTQQTKERHLKESTKKVIDLVDSGMKQSDVARKLGMTRQRVSDIVLSKDRYEINKIKKEAIYDHITETQNKSQF